MWYVCYCEPKRALALVAALRAEGCEAECPSFRFRRRKPRRNSTEEIERPLIGGIFFCRTEHWPLGPGMVSGIDLDSIRRMMWMGRPATVLDSELEDLRKSSHQRTEERSTLKAGDEVEVVTGPFSGRKGIISGRNRDFFCVALEGFELELQITPFLLRKNRA